MVTNKRFNFTPYVFYTLNVCEYPSSSSKRYDKISGTRARCHYRICLRQNRQLSNSRRNNRQFKARV